MAAHQTTTPLMELYEQDETAWLEEMARLASERRPDEFDYDHLAEYLIAMASRDRREVVSRMVILIAHLLKWEAQPGHQSRSWEATINEQRRQLADLLASSTLRHHAEAILETAYRRGLSLASGESGLPELNFRSENPYSLGEILGEE